MTIVANIDGSGARTLEASESGNVIRGARWSPDSTKLVYQERIGGTRDVGRLVIENLASGRRTLVTDPKLTVANWYFLWPRFSADGKKVIFHLARGPHGSSKFDVWSVSVTGGKPKLVLRDASFPVPFPDGETIAFVPGARGFYGYSIAIADSQGSGRRTLVETGAPIWWPAISPDGRKLTYVVGNSVLLAEVSTGKHERVAYGTSA